MDSKTLDIDRIVCEIVRRLRAEMEDQPVAALTLDGRVITMSELKGKLEGVRQLIVQCRAILTPSVRDELREKKIEIVRAPAESSSCE